MLRTAFASAAVAVLGAAAASWLTQGFQVWTAEGARRLAVLESPVATPAVELGGPGVTGLDLHAVLANPTQVTIVEFIYTRCNSICIGLGSGFQQLQRQIAQGRLGGVRLLSISFDPEHDDTTRLQQYALRWQADPGHWRFATVPDNRDLQRLLHDFQVVVVPDGQGGYEHNAALLVIDGQGRLVRIFDATDPDAALAFALSIQQPGATL